MKKLLLIFCLTFTVLSAYTQSDDSCIVYSEKHNEVLYLYMNPDCYNKLSELYKMALIESEAEKNSVKFISVVNAHKIELWSVYDGTRIIDKWDKNNVEYKTYDNNENGAVRSLKHPWFFNISGSMAFTKNDNMFYLTGYGRIGFYLLKGRWDLAVNNVLSYSKEMMNHVRVENGQVIHDELKHSFTGSFGVDTRVYFPIKSINTSPFVGVGLARTYGDGNKSTAIPVSLGLSVMVKRGSIDACYQYEKTTNGIFVVGYTFMLK